MPPPKKDKNAPAEAPVAPVEKKDDISHLLLKKYNMQRHSQQSDLFEFTHGKYEEWMDFFGFNLESEFRWQNEEKKQQSTKGRKSVVGAIRNKTTATREVGATAKVVPPASAGTTVTAATMPTGAGVASKKDADGAPPSGSSKDAIDPVATAPLSEDVGVMTPELLHRFEAVDKVALEVGSAQGATWEEVAKQLGEPYARATYLQTTSQCTHFKSRAVFRWLCEHMKLLPPTPAASSSPNQLGSVTLPEVGAKAAKGGKGGKPPAGPSATKGGGGGKDAAVTNEPLTDDKKIELAFTNRSSDSETLALLYAAMLQSLNVECVAVKGTLKGLLDQLGKHTGALSWGWNVLSIPIEADTEAEPDINTLAITKQDEKRHQRTFGYGTSQRVAEGRTRFLVDVSLAMNYVGARAGITPPKDVIAATGAAGGKEAAPEKGKGGKETTTPRKTAAVTETQPTTEDPRIDCFGFTQPPDYSTHFEPFYYCTSPRKFAALHFPDDSVHQLFHKPLGRTQWEIYPRLSHDFYNLDLELGSHKRRSWLTVKRTPFYVSFTLNNTRTTDLVLHIFKGTAPSVDENSKPLDSKFVWSTREEKEGRQTFSIMLPDVGLYTLAIGARKIDDDTNWGGEGPTSPTAAIGAPATTTPATAEASNSGNPDLTSYRLVAQYQTLVNFVPANETMYPRQLVTPGLAKLVGPVSHKCVSGANLISVVPTNPRVRAVAVVNKVYKVILKTADGRGKLISDAGSEAPPSHPTTPGEGAKRPKKGDPKAAAASPLDPTKPKPPTVDEPVVERTELHLLPLNADKGLFEGMLDLELGLVEIWLLLEHPQQAGSKKGAGKKPGTAKKEEGFQTNLADPEALYLKYMQAGSSYKGPVEGEAAVQLGLKEIPPHGDGAEALSEEGAVTPAPVTSSGPDGTGPDSGFSNQADEKDIEHLGLFIPFVTEIHCVKRIPAKELNVNEGEPLIRPFILDWESDRPFILRLLAKTSLDGRNWDPKPLKAGFLEKDLHKVGGYFQHRPDAMAKMPKKLPPGAGPESEDDEESGY